MSYIDPRTGEWKAGLPPGVSLAEAQARVARARHGERLELAEGPSSVHVAPEERFTETLAQAQARRRAHQAAERSAWLTEAEACAALELDAHALYRDVELLTECQACDGELMFSAAAVAARAQGSADSDAKARADQLLAEMRKAGLDLLGGGAA